MKTEWLSRPPFLRWNHPRSHQEGSLSVCLQKRHLIIRQIGSFDRGRSVKMSEKLTLLSFDWFCAVSCPENRPVHHALTALTQSRSFKTLGYMNRCPETKYKFACAPSKAQIRLRIRAVWSESSMGRSVGSQVPRVSSGEKLRLWSDCAGLTDFKGVRALRGYLPPPPPPPPLWGQKIKVALHKFLFVSL